MVLKSRRQQLFTKVKNNPGTIFFFFCFPPINLRVCDQFCLPHVERVQERLWVSAERVRGGGEVERRRWGERKRERERWGCFLCSENTHCVWEQTARGVLQVITATTKIRPAMKRCWTRESFVARSLRGITRRKRKWECRCLFHGSKWPELSSWTETDSAHFQMIPCGVSADSVSSQDALISEPE